MMCSMPNKGKPEKTTSTNPPAKNPAPAAPPTAKPAAKPINPPKK